MLISLEVQPEIEDIICPCSFLELGVGEQKEWKYQLIPENAYGKDFLRAVSKAISPSDYQYERNESLSDDELLYYNEIQEILKSINAQMSKHEIDHCKGIVI